MRFDRLPLRPVLAAARSGRGKLTGEAERALDAIFAGPLPEAVGRSMAEHHVVERVAAGMLDETPRVGDGARQGRTPEGAFGENTDALAEELTQRLVNSAAFKHALTEVLSRPEIRTALASQATGFGAEVAAVVRRRSRALDQRLEGPVRRLFGRKPRPSDEPARFGGFATRGAGLVLDAALAQLGFLVAAASVALVLALVGDFGPNWLNVTLAGAGWFLAAAIYFVVFWSGTGQTPGMRALGVRVVAPSGKPPSVLRSLVRFVGLILAIIPLFAGFLPALVDDRRRALHDFLSGTVVVDEPA